MRARLPVSAVCLAAAAGCLGDLREDTPVPGSLIPARPSRLETRVQAAHNDDTLFLRVRFPAELGERHELWHRADGAWRLEGGGFREVAAALAGDEQRALFPDAVSVGAELQLSVLLDDPSSPGRLLAFREQGCFGQCHDRQRQMPNWRAEDGAKPMTVWTGVGKGDLWVWRSHRTALAGFADDLSFTPAGYVPDAGAVPYSAVALTGTAQMPAWLFDPSDAGAWAFPYDTVIAQGPYAFDDGSLDGVANAMTVGSALASGYAPADGDTVPAWLLAMPGGSRADVAADATWSDGAWDLVLSRKLVTGDAIGDLALPLGKPYGIALALHRDGADGRDHYVSLPLTLLLDTAGEGVAVTAVAGTGTPSFDESGFPVTELALFLPGLTSFDWLVGAPAHRDGTVRTVDVVHGGGFEVATAQFRCADCHTVRAEDPLPPQMNAGPLERLVLRRGGVYSPTPFFDERAEASEESP